MIQRCDISERDVIDGRFQVKTKLGEGSFGQVFKVEDRQTHSQVALKLLKLWCIAPDERVGLRQRFDMEYETGQIDSPFLVHSIGRGTYKDNPYIVMEYCTGGDLSHAVKDPHFDITKAATEILLGLKALHAQGKVHRDLKPENVLIKANGSAALTDYGISGDQNHRVTRRGILGIPKEIMGTFIYMPPEQMRPPRGNATVLPTTDIFSFGVMLYELITHQLPFGSLHNSDDLERYSERARMGKWDRDRLVSTPQGKTYVKLIEGCLESNYKKRLQTVDAVLSLLPGGVAKVGITPNVSVQTPKGRHLQLRVMQGEEVGRTYLLNPLLTKDTSTLHMGRQNSDIANDIAIHETQSAYISRRHCTLEYDRNERQWYLWDGQWNEQLHQWRPSLNGTFIGSREASIDDAVPLHVGDIITIGDVTLKVEVS